ncbi:hypothetical protein ACQ3G6_15360 [Allorhizobium undicola]
MDEDLQKLRQRKRRSASTSGKIGVVNLALLFAVAAVALTLVVTPMLVGNHDTAPVAFRSTDLDTMSTGSIPVERDASGKRYTIRRSVLQTAPDTVCIVNHDGGDGC